MTFLGVASCNKDAEYITKVIKRELNDDSIKVLSINKESIDNLKNIKFDTVLLDDFVIDSEDKEVLKGIINNSKTVIVNSDISDNLKLLNNYKKTIITYGFNVNANISLSSIEDDNNIICIQRNIITKNGKCIEQQDKNIETSIKNKKINSTKGLGVLAVELFYDRNLL